MEIQLLTRERLKNVAELNWLMESQPSPLDNGSPTTTQSHPPLLITGSPTTCTYINPSPLDNWISYYMYIYRSQPSPLDNWISYYMYIYRSQPSPLDNWISYYIYTDLNPPLL